MSDDEPSLITSVDIVHDDAILDDGIDRQVKPEEFKVESKLDDELPPTEDVTKLLNRLYVGEVNRVVTDAVDSDKELIDNIDTQVIYLKRPDSIRHTLRIRIPGATSVYEEFGLAAIESSNHPFWQNIIDLVSIRMMKSSDEKRKGGVLEGSAYIQVLAGYDYVISSIVHAKPKAFIVTPQGKDSKDMMPFSNIDGELQRLKGLGLWVMNNENFLTGLILLDGLDCEKLYEMVTSAIYVKIGWNY